MVAPWRNQRAPSCLYQCYNDDRQGLDPLKYYQHKRQENEELEHMDWIKIIAACDLIANEEQKESNKVKQTAGRKRKFDPPDVRIFKDPEDDTVKSFGPQHTEWYRIYVEDPQVDNMKFRMKFRRRFRCSYLSYQKHVQEVKDSPLFKAWANGATNCAGKRSSPIELLVLGALRYIGRGWCFDDLEEQTCISEETHGRFMHVYLLWGSTTLYEKYVIQPENGQQAREWAMEYEFAGLHGCISSGDATHVGMLKCFHRLKQHNASFKLNMPSRTYNTHVSHRRRIIHSTPGHPGRWNDKTLQLFDSFAKVMRDGEKYDDLVFELLEQDEDGTIKRVKYRGAWEIVDNGYLPWPTMVPPSKSYATYAEMRFSKWLESLRKDVECTFGILKGRFRILKTGIPLHGIDVCDRMWLTCCALHNFFMEEDELDERWDASQYLSEEGNHDDCDVRRFVGGTNQNFDSSGMGVGTDLIGVNKSTMGPLREEEVCGEDGLLVHGAIPLHRLRLDFFKSKLIEHFDILWKQNKIRWPSCTGSAPPSTILVHLN